MSEELVINDKNEIVEISPLKTDEELDAIEDAEDAKAAAAEDEPPAEIEAEVDVNDPEREAIRQRRREERKHKKEVQRGREESLRRELSSEREARTKLEGRLSVIERKASGMEMSTLDSHIKQTGDAYSYFKNQIAVSSAAGDHAAIADSTEKMILARDRMNQLQNVKKGYNQTQAQPPALDPNLLRHANAWMENNKWYDPDGKDEDSFLASKIDERLSSEGWMPSTEAYWKELDVRLKKHLPHRYAKSYTTQSTPRSPVSGSGRDSSERSSGTYKLSADRVAAMKEAGIEVGSKEFTEMVKEYKNYDKQQSAAGN